MNMTHVHGNINRGGITVDKDKNEVVQEHPKKELKKEQPKKEFSDGVVIDCLLLAIRKGPDQNSDLCGTLAPGRKVTININESTEYFYSITTDDGLYGFCMKSFIKVK